MIIGFTGSRLGMSPAQAETLITELHQLGARQLHHGDCQGADEQAHQISRTLGLYVVGHPPTGNGLRAFCECDELRAAKEFMLRNHDIVHETQTLIATPDGPERRRSGTWATIRYGVKLLHPVVIIDPGGLTTRVNS